MRRERERLVANPSGIWQERDVAHLLSLALIDLRPTWVRFEEEANGASADAIFAQQLALERHVCSDLHVESLLLHRRERRRQEQHGVLRGRRAARRQTYET